MAESETPDFPIPFAGIDGYIEMDKDEVLLAVGALMSCGHGHNYAVELDAPSPRLYTSATGARCVGDVLLPQRKEASVVDRVVALWNREDGWIPGAAYKQLAEALDVDPDILLETRKERADGSRA